jgi:glutamine synthetase
LELDFFKDEGEEKFYLQKDRSYRSERDVFEYYTEEERNKKFGIPPATVWENIKNFDLELCKNEVLYAGDVFNKEIINSYKEATITQFFIISDIL